MCHISHKTDRHTYTLPSLSLPEECVTGHVCVRFCFVFAHQISSQGCCRRGRRRRCRCLGKTLVEKEDPKDRGFYGTLKAETAPPPHRTTKNPLLATAQTRRPDAWFLLTRSTRMRRDAAAAAAEHCCVCVLFRSKVTTWTAAACLRGEELSSGGGGCAEEEDIQILP